MVQILDCPVKVTCNCYHRHTETMFYLSSLKDVVGSPKGVKEAVLSLQENGAEILLPYAVSISKNPHWIEAKGRAKKPYYATFDGVFRSVQRSRYKVYKPYKVHTCLWQVEGCAGYYFGTLGLTQADGKIKDNGDLLLVRWDDVQGVLETFVFDGLANTFRGRRISTMAGVQLALEIIRKGEKSKTIPLN